MAINRVPISMLSATALADYVTANMGLDVKAQMGITAIKAKMALAGFQTDTIDLDDGKDEPEIKRVEPKRVRHTPGKRMVQLRIEPSDKPGGNEPVYSNVNGQAILIPRGKTVWVDFKYYHALGNAVARVPITDEDSKIVGWRDVPETPMSVLHIEGRLSAREQKLSDEQEAKRIAAEAAAARGEDIPEEEDEYA